MEIEETYEKMDSAIEFDDLIDCGHKLVEFADAAVVVKNKHTIVNQFFENLLYTVMIPYVFDRPDEAHYYLCEKKEAIGMYVYFMIGGKQTPVKSLKKIKQVGEHIIANYTTPIGDIIPKETILEIMECLDAKFSFSKKIMNARLVPIIYAIIPYSNREFNSQCVVTKENTIPIVFLYHMRTDDVESANPIAVFFHELGHMLHTRYTKNPHWIPDEILDILRDTCFPTIKEASIYDQCEIFADVLSVGLMQDTKFEEYSLFKCFQADEKKIFEMLVKKLLAAL